MLATIAVVKTNFQAILKPARRVGQLQKIIQNAIVRPAPPVIAEAELNINRDCSLNFRKNFSN